MFLIDLRIGRLVIRFVFRRVRLSVGVIIGLRVCLSLFLALLYIYNITGKRGLLCVYNLGRQPNTHARVLIICKKNFFLTRGGVGRKVVGGNRCTAPSPTDSWALHILFR